MPENAPLALVVDDDALILMDAADILAEAGFKPLEAMNVADALVMLEAHSAEVAVLFTDVQMPGDRDGFSLAREVAERWPEIQIVVASGRARPGKGDLPEGAAFIQKPFSADIVRERLRKALPNERQPDPLQR